MALGPGKYDNQLLQVMLKTGAAAACLVIVGGRRGHGVSCKVRTPPGVSGAFVAQVHRELAQALRTIANQMDADADELATTLDKN